MAIVRVKTKSSTNKIGPERFHRPWGGLLGAFVVRAFGRLSFMVLLVGVFGVLGAPSSAGPPSAAAVGKAFCPRFAFRADFLARCASGPNLPAEGSGVTI